MVGHGDCSYDFRSKADLARAVWLRIVSSFVPGILQMMASDRCNHETSRRAAVSAPDISHIVRAGIRAAAFAGSPSAASRGKRGAAGRGKAGAVAMAAGANALVEPETRYLTWRTGRLHARLRSGKPGVALRRDVPVHIDALTDLQRVCPHILWRRSPSHRPDCCIRANQERLRRLSRDRPAAEDRR